MISDDLAAYIAGEMPLAAVRTVALDGSELTEAERALFVESIQELLEQSSTVVQVDLQQLHLPQVSLPAQMPNLESLRLDHCEIDSLRLPTHAPQLHTLSVVHNNLEQVAVADFHQLSHLAISGNKALTINGLTQLHQLHTLHARQLPRLEVDALTALKNLAILHLDCWHSDALQMLPSNLVQLYLSLPTATAVGIPLLPKMTQFALTRSPFLKAIELPALPQLHILDISYNALHTLPDLSQLPALKQLKCKGLALKDLTALRVLSEKGVSVVY